MMRREKGSTRPPLTDAQKAAKPPVSQPVVMQHPITGKPVLYVNPGYAMRINELPQETSDDWLDFLFKHQLQTQFQYQHLWQEGDVLMWDNMGTVHNAVADYKPHEHRFIKRCQVMATKFFHADGTRRDGHVGAHA
jgi:taurine dioxygenase